MLNTYKPKLSLYIGVSLDESFAERLQNLSHEYRISMSDIVRQACHTVIPAWEAQGLSLTPTRKPRTERRAA